VLVCRIGKLRTLHVLGGIGLEPGAACVTVDTALDEVVGSGGAGHDVEEDRDHHRKNAERGHGRIFSPPPNEMCGLSLGEADALFGGEEGG
jgi:hypothetical protein